MRDCKSTLQLGSSCTVVVYLIANGYVELAQTVEVVNWDLENICHLFLAS